MQVPHGHTFHIPVLGLAFSADTPIRVARFGISSVISIVDDVLESYNRPEPVEQKEYLDSVKAKLALIDDDLHNYLKKSKSNKNW